MPNFVVYDLETGAPIRTGFTNHRWRSMVGGDDLHHDYDTEDKYAPYHGETQGILEVGPDFDFYWSRIFDDQVVHLEKPIDRIRLMGKIDMEAERVRGRFVTPGSGQAMVYQQKAAEAEIVLTSDFSPEKVPHIAAEAGQAGITLAEQAEIVLAMRDQWLAVSAAIESRRLAAKTAVRAAQTQAEADQAAEVDWSDIEALAQ